MSKQLKREIDSIVAQLVANYRPEKVILFGSAARGDATEESDVDLLVIKKTNKAFHDRMMEARRGVRVNRAMDLVVYTPQEVRKRLYLGDPFIKQVVEGGRTVYGT